MKLGIKVNADKEYIDRLNGSRATFAEVWFHVNNETSYTELFDELKRRKCEVGLHFWGLLDNNVAPNIAYPNKKTLTQSMTLMKKAIDIAAANGFSYVNIHPGAAALSKVNYEQERYDCFTDPVDMDLATQTCLEHALKLNTYANNHNVVLTVETVPIRITDGWYETSSRNNPKNIYELPVSAIQTLAKHGISVANDFCHTAANVIHDDRHAVYTFVKGATMALLQQTRLIHLGYVVRPFNGTDNHDTFDNPVFESQDAVPNKSETMELLKLFNNKPDVWILAEPKDHHVENYQYLHKLITGLGIPFS